MVKLRRNHQRSAAFGVRILVLILLASFALSWFIFRMAPRDRATSPDLGELITTEDPMWYLPATAAGDLYFKDHYTLSYAESHEQPEWVAYQLTRASLEVPNVDRTDWFEEDPQILTGSATYHDYTGSGYTRGHLVPAGDMAFSTEAMAATFFMSNISPQKRAFNNGVWKELEMQARDWAYAFDTLVVITGPVLSGDLTDRVGRNKVTVPAYFYKIVATARPDGWRSASFVIPNDLCDAPLEKYAVSIDSIETLTGIDFFPKLFSPEVEAAIESRVALDDWPFSESRYLTRINRWNKE